MNELRRFILESHFEPTFAKAVFESLCLLEAVNINKDFLIKTAGSPEKFAEAKNAVQAKWKSENMDAQLNQKAAQKVLNLLYLMEIRKPGFTDNAKLHSIHDLYLHNMLDTKFLNVVNSDTTPEQADAALHDAVAHQIQQQKTYPDLSEEEEKIWNRVKVYHEFPDGFKWVYAVDEKGKITSHIPSDITAKTMNHCGNTPRAGSDDQYWELRDANGKAYLTIILNKDGELEESKSWGNQASKYRREIQPYVKWFLMDKVTGVGHRYDYGYSTHTNYGMKDFIGDDPEFVNYVIEFKPALLGNTEEKIQFWQGAVEAGIVSKDQMKQLFIKNLAIDELLEQPQFKEYTKSSKFKYDKDGSSYSSSVFGANRFEVLCASCDGCPFTQEELKKCILEGDIGFEEFVNYDTHLLTPEMQHAFVERDSMYFDSIVNLSEQVAAFKVDEKLVDALIEPLRNGPSNTANRLLRYLACSNPPDKVHQCAHDVMENETIMGNMFRGHDSTGVRKRMLERMFPVLARFSDLKILPVLKDVFAEVMWEAADNQNPSQWHYHPAEVMKGAFSLGTERGYEFIKSVPPETIVSVMTPINDDDFDDTMAKTGNAAKLRKLYGPEYECTKFVNGRARLLYMLNLSKEGITVPGMENIAGTVADTVKKIVHGKMHDPGRDAYSTYLLGLSANPDTCDLLDPGELSIFMCMCQQNGYYDVLRDQGTPAIYQRCFEDIRHVNAHPDKNVIRRYARLCLFEMLDRISGDSPTPEFDALIRDSLYMRATMFGQYLNHDYWNDMPRHFSNLVRNKFITLPVEEWPKWVKLLGGDNFIKWYIACINPDALYEDDLAMGCIIRYITGHDMFCTDTELAQPGTEKNDVDEAINGMFDNVTSDTRNRLCKVIAAKISPKVEKGQLYISADALKCLGEYGMINPKAYRKALEMSVRGVSGEVGNDAEISANEVWKLIRSPMLPRLIYNTLVNNFKKYKEHKFTKGHEWTEEFTSANKFIRMVNKVYDKRDYYQVMRAVNLLEESGSLKQMDDFATKLDATSELDYKKRWKSFGYEYDLYYSRQMSFMITRLINLVSRYKANPIPEPKTKTRNRKVSNGQTA